MFFRHAAIFALLPMAFIPLLYEHESNNNPNLSLKVLTKGPVLRCWMTSNTIWLQIRMIFLDQGSNKIPSFAVECNISFFICSHRGCLSLPSYRYEGNAFYMSKAFFCVACEIGIEDYDQLKFSLQSTVMRYCMIKWLYITNSIPLVLR